MSIPRSKDRKITRSKNVPTPGMKNPVSKKSRIIHELFMRRKYEDLDEPKYPE